MQRKSSMDEMFTGLRSEQSGDLEKLRIVLLGVSGAGKSSIGNAILGREVFKESRSRESEKRGGRVEDRNISIVDTPGFLNPRLTDEELQEQMMKSLDLSHPGPHVFLLIVNLETFEEDKRDVVEEIQKKFGPQVFKFSLVLFIGRENISKRKWTYLRNTTQFQDLVKKCKNNHQEISSQGEINSTHIKTLLEKIDKLIKQNDGQHYERPADLRIVLLGKTGAGKSSTGNTILGKKLFHVKQAFQSVTKECEKHQQTVEGRNISVIDTPGLFDTSMNEEELKKEIEKCVEMSVPGPHVFLLIVRLDVKFTEEEKNSVKWIQENFGEAASCYTILLFTGGDQLETPIEKLLTEGDECFKQIVERCKGGYHVFNNKDKENRSQVTELLEIIDRMVKKNGGDYYTNEMYKEAQRKIKEEERKRLMKKAAVVTTSVVGTAAAVTGTALLATATGGLAVPIALTAGGVILSGGSAVKTAVEKVHDHRKERRNVAMGYNVLQDDDDDESDT